MTCKFCSQPRAQRKDRPGKFHTMCEKHLRKYKREHAQKRRVLPEVRKRHQENKLRHREKPGVRERERLYAQVQSSDYYYAHKSERNKKNAIYRKTEAGRASRARTKAKRRATIALGTIDRQVLFERDYGVCQICRAPISERNLVLGWLGICSRQNPFQPSEDHIVPIAVGGKHSYANVQLAHLRCNQQKNAKMEQ